MSKCTVICLGALSPLIGCQGIQIDDPGAYALAHRALPPEFLRQAGAPLTYEAMPFICGGIVREAESASSRPVPPPILTKPEPKYVVDLTKVEEVRTAWMGGRRITVLRHPYVEKDLAGYSSERPQPPSRISVKGHSLCGCGPVSIWRGGEFLYFSDEPWMLLDVTGESGPWLLTCHDNPGAGGPIEIHAFTAPDRVGRDWCLIWIDLAATGRPVEITVRTEAKGRPVVSFALRDEKGDFRDVGRIAFDAAKGEFVFTDLEAATRPAKEDRRFVRCGPLETTTAPCGATGPRR